ncbi:GNAT family N-acetyltransferase [Sedimentibacter sp. zth1]|uniref:GNAT family N-acetyltransferase n=1 Tax=Sedimentibacter sp. zth1 TaxID=2816908 RepID=UPI001A92DD6E|nr:GNAT family N-acetyltransferase [Sedimentibacter sp. zth1]QSX06637.1 GNAT family N-acetyltransferase [Sedimentibacter sp. zth1]
MIRKARKNDINTVEKVYNDLFDYEEKNKNYSSWHRGIYPTRIVAENSLNEGTLFVGEEDGIIFGSVILNKIQAMEYKKINWKYIANEEEVLVIHTLCISPLFSRKGKGKEFMMFIENYAKEQNYKVIRLDTNEDNIPAASLYNKLGYRYAGIEEFYFMNKYKENLKCFEKEIIY